MPVRIEEAVMATVTICSLFQREPAAGAPNTVLAALREMLDALATNRMRRAAAEAEHGRRRQREGAPMQTGNSQ